MKPRSISTIFTSFLAVAEALQCGFRVLDMRTQEPITDADLERLSVADLDRLQLQIV